eukprot:5128060-Amphidinium_carterae.1
MHAVGAGLSQWLQSVLEGVSQHELADEDEFRSFYTILGLSPDLLDLCCSECHLVWVAESQRLCVSAEFLARPDSISQLSVLLAGMWQ